MLMGTRNMEEKRVCLFPNSKEQKTRGTTVTPFSLTPHIVFFPFPHVVSHIAHHQPHHRVQFLSDALPCVRFHEKH